MKYVATMPQCRRVGEVICMEIVDRELTDLAVQTALDEADETLRSPSPSLPAE
jgi:hypothetical protein